ncbi:MAG: DUF1007 family protein [Beijerinckiaceae bacterium]|nr:DUF1007 family protein [Beijerinckiaceae bacterium]
MTSVKSSALASAALAIALLIENAPAGAHPHVFIVAKSELVYDSSGNFTAVKQHWTFDESYSAFAVQGLDSKKDGKFTREDLAGLAKINVESLAEYDYFSFGKSSGKKLEFGQPENYWLDYADGKLTLNFTLPTKAPISGRTLTFQVYDPTYFVSFVFDGPQAVTLQGAAAGCTVSIKAPPRFDTGASKSLSEEFFNQLSASSDYGAGQADRALVACP